MSEKIIYVVQERPIYIEPEKPPTKLAPGALLYGSLYHAFKLSYEALFYLLSPDLFRVGFCAGFLKASADFTAGGSVAELLSEKESRNFSAFCYKDSSSFFSLSSFFSPKNLKFRWMAGQLAIPLVLRSLPSKIQWFSSYWCLYESFCYGEEIGQRAWQWLQPPTPLKGEK